MNDKQLIKHSRELVQENKDNPLSDRVIELADALERRVIYFK